MEPLRSPPGLLLQDVAMGSSSHQLKITLTNVRPPIWRRLLVPSDYTLAQVSEVVLAGMGWVGSHLYAFVIGRTTYMEIDEDSPDDSFDPASVRLGDLVGPGDRFSFEYDFGDGWEHQVLVEAVEPSAGRPKPVCLAGRRACPPEDVGGPFGYAEFLDAITNPEHEQHEELLEWIGGGFDPEAFDRAAVDRLLATIPGPPT